VPTCEQEEALLEISTGRERLELGAHERGQRRPRLRLEALQKLRQMLAHEDERVALLGRPRDVLALGRAATRLADARTEPDAEPSAPAAVRASVSAASQS